MYQIMWNFTLYLGTKTVFPAMHIENNIKNPVSSSRFCLPLAKTYRELLPQFSIHFYAFAPKLLELTKK